jgi:hypothetical protein
MQTFGLEAAGEINAQRRPYIVAKGCADNLAAPTAPFGAPTRITSVPHSYRNYLLFSLCAAPYLLPFMRLLWIGTDEGTLVDGAVRVLHGQIFARDFFEVMGPGTFYWLAMFFKLFGISFLSERICLFVTSLGTMLLMYFLSRRVCAQYWSLAPVLLMAVYFGTIWPMVNHHVDSNFFALLSIACLAKWQDVSNNRVLVAAGVFAAVTTLVLQPKGLLVFFAMLLWVWIEQRRRSASSTVLILVAAYCSMIAVVLIYFWSRGALHDLLYMNFVWPYQNYGAVNAIPYAGDLLQYWTHWIVAFHRAHWLTPLAAILFAPYLIVATLPILVLLLGIPHGKDNLRGDILLYWLCGGALWLSEIHRRDVSHLASGSPVLLILCVHFLTVYRGKIANVALQFLSVSSVALAIVNLFIVLSAHPLPTRVGLVATFKVDPVLAFLDDHVPPGTEIFTYPYSPMYYFLSSTTNPTRYSILMYNYNTTSQFQDAIRTLNQHKVRYVVWNTSFEKDAADLFSAKSFEPPGGLLMEPYLESHYRAIQRFGGMQIMERKADARENQR